MSGATEHSRNMDRATAGAMQCVPVVVADVVLSLPLLRLLCFVMKPLACCLSCVSKCKWDSITVMIKLCRMLLQITFCKGFIEDELFRSMFRL